MPNSDHPLLEQVEKLRADAKNLDKQKRKAAKHFDVQRRILESRVETLVRKYTRIEKILLARDSIRYVNGLFFFRNV